MDRFTPSVLGLLVFNVLLVLGIAWALIGQPDARTSSQQSGWVAPWHAQSASSGNSHAPWPVLNARGKQVNAALLWTGLGLALVGTIWFYIATFAVSVWWGFACLFLPFASLIFTLLHFNRVAVPIGLSIIGVLLIFVA